MLISSILSAEAAQLESSVKRLASNRTLVLAMTFLTVVAIGLPFVRLDPFPYHEGLILYPSVMVNHGYAPIRDVFFPHAPTTAYFYAVLFRLFGEKMLVSRIATLVGISTVVVLMTLIASRFLPIGIAACFSLLYCVTSWLLWDLVTRPWPTLWGLIFLLAACLLVTQWTACRRPRYLVLAGIMIGMAATFRMNLGLYGAIALTAALALVVNNLDRHCRLRTRLGAMAVVILQIGLPAGIVVAAAFGLFIYRWGGLSPLWSLLEFQRSQPALAYAMFGDTFSLANNLALDRAGCYAAALYLFGPVLLFDVVASRQVSVWTKRAAGAGVVLSLTALQAESPWNVPMLCLGPGVLAVAVWDLWRNRIFPDKESRYGYLVLMLTALASWGIMYPGGDPRYSAWAGCALAVLVVCRLHLKCQLAEKSGREVAILLASTTTLLLLSTSHVRNSWHVLRSERITLNDGFYAGMRPLAARGREYVALKQYVDANTSPDDGVLIWKGDLMHYAYLNRRSPLLPIASVDNLIYLLPQGKKIEAELLEKVERAPPALVVLDPTRSEERSWDIAAGLFSGSFPRLQRYIELNYSEVWRTPNQDYIVLERNATLTPTGVPHPSGMK